MKTTAIWILAGIFASIAVVLGQTNHLTLSIWFGIISVAFLLFSLLTHHTETKTIEQKTVYSPPEPLKIIILDNKEIFQTTYEGDPVEWNKFISALITNPFFPTKLRTTIQLQGAETFLLVDLLNKKLITPIPQNIIDLKTKAVALIHKEFMSDLPIEVRATILFKNYIEGRA